MITYFTWGLLAVGFYCWKQYLQRKRKTGEPPLEHHPIPYLGHALEFGKDPEGCLKRLKRKHGDVFTIKMMGRYYHVFMNSLDIILIKNNTHLQRGPIVNGFLTRLVGNQHSVHQTKHDISGLSVKSMLKKIFALIQSNNKEHVKMKSNDSLNQTDNEKTVYQAIKENLIGTKDRQNLFLSSLKNTNNIIKAIWEKKFSINEPGEMVNLYEFCNRIIFYISFAVLFGTLPDEDESLNEISSFYEVFSRYDKQSALVVRGLPIDLLPEVKKARKEIFEMLKRIDWSKRINLSNMVACVREADNNPEHQIRHMLIALWAAQNNTAPGFFWMLFYILSNPKIEYSIRKEFDTFFNSQNQCGPSHHKDLKQASIFPKYLCMEKLELEKLVVLDSVFKEMTRMSASNTVAKRAIEDTSVKTSDEKRFKIRKGDYTLFYTPLFHYDSEVFRNPTEFQHDRFFEENRFYKNGQELSSSSTIMLFGVGQQRCPGRHLASMEIKLLTLSLLKNFNISLLSFEKPNMDYSQLGFGIMPPKEIVLAKFLKKKD